MFPKSCSSIFIFDNTSVYYDSDNLINLQKMVNRELKKIKKWFDANRLQCRTKTVKLKMVDTDVEC